MKKPLMTVEAFQRALAEIEEELHLPEHVARAAREDPDGDADEWLRMARLLVSEPAPAAPRGRGERVAVEVSTLWNQPPFGTDAEPLAALRRRVAALPGVEEVGEATADTQLHAVWGFTAVLRWTQ